MKLCHLVDSTVQVGACMIVDVLLLDTLCIEPNLRKRGLWVLFSHAKEGLRSLGLLVGVWDPLLSQSLLNHVLSDHWLVAHASICQDLWVSDHTPRHRASEVLAGGKGIHESGAIVRKLLGHLLTELPLLAFILRLVLKVLQYLSIDNVSMINRVGQPMLPQAQIQALLTGLIKFDVSELRAHHSLRAVLRGPQQIVILLELLLQVTAHVTVCKRLRTTALVLLRL